MSKTLNSNEELVPNSLKKIIRESLKQYVGKTDYDKQIESARNIINRILGEPSEDDDLDGPKLP